MLIFGAPGVGKGTQGKALGCIPGFVHVATGDMFREIDPQSEQGRTFASYSVRGELVPDEFTVELWRAHMKKLVAKGSYKPERDLLILDGIPRSSEQAQRMADDIDVLALIHLRAGDEDELLRRMQRRAKLENRIDDADENVIRNRWAVYRQQTMPVLNSYDTNLIHEIDAMGSPCRVLLRVLEAVAPIHEKHFGNAFEA
jgi:adenylate kinase